MVKSTVIKVNTIPTTDNHEGSQVKSASDIKSKLNNDLMITIQIDKCSGKTLSRCLRRWRVVSQFLNEQFN